MPVFRPSNPEFPTELTATEGDDGVRSGYGPEHARSFESADDSFAASFDRPGSNEKPLLAKLRPRTTRMHLPSLRYASIVQAMIVVCDDLAEDFVQSDGDLPVGIVGF